jgi:hypothetical protein
MLKKLAAFVLPILLLNLSVGTIWAKPDTDKELRHAEKVKQAIYKLGVGQNSLVKLTLRDKTKVEGFVSEINDEYFVVINLQTGVATTVAYPGVKQIRGNNLSTKTKIAIGVGIALGVLVIIAAVNGNIGRRNNHPLEDAFKKFPLPTGP